MKNWKALLLIPLVAGMGLFLAGCSDAEVVSQRLSTDADYFKIERRIVFYNGINGEYMLTVEGKCSIYDDGNQLEVTCKTGEETYKKHFLGLSDNVTYFVEQVKEKVEDPYHYLVVFKPATIIPDIDIR